ncbi:MAG: DUF4743 domain-containing protein [Inquilinus sp.]|nr:DUF4743 domain-containing protein [Inquilinus sp.]
MALIDRIAACNVHDLSQYRHFRIGDAPVGWLRPELIRRLAAYPAVFVADGEELVLAPGLSDPDARTEAVGEVVARLSESGELPALRGEQFSVKTHWGAPALLAIDRGVAARFGILSFGLHVNGHVDGADGLEMWIGRRARDRLVAPGELDHIVAGGQPHGLTLTENLLKECAEEADLPPDLALTARPAGAITYTMEARGGLKRDVIFVYDLAVPAGFEPRNTDGEVEAFFRWPIAEILARLRDTDDFKFNVGPVIIDFMIRHGVLTPDEPGYVEMLKALRR